MRSSVLVLAVLLGACSRREPPGIAPAESAAFAPGDSAPLPIASADEPDDQTIDLDAHAPTATVDPTEIPTGPEYEPLAGSPHQIGAIATMTWVYAGPNDETLKLGYLRAGAIVARGEKPVAHTKRCPKGWYRVAPEGFVCDGNRATIDLNDPTVVASAKRPLRGEPLPYRYGRSKEQPPNLYVKVPTKKEQERAEPGLESHLSSPAEREREIAIVGEPEPLPDFLQNGRFLPKPFGATQRLRVVSHEGKANAHSAFAFLDVFDVEGRLFGLSTDLNLIALDRVNLVRTTPIHGGEVKDLPAGLVLAPGQPKYVMDETGHPKKDGAFERFDTVSLTGQTRGDLWETTDGAWIGAGAFRMFEKRREWPSFAKPEPGKPPKKWVDVSINDQTLVAYEGQRAVYLARISSGIGGTGDPEKTHATKRGVFTIKSKHITALMTGDEAVDDYELADVPYVQYFEGGYALHAAFWHESFGRTYSHGCVNLPPTDAAWLFEWTDPPVPTDWHGIQANGEGSIVYVHP